MVWSKEIYVYIFFNLCMSNGDAKQWNFDFCISVVKYKYLSATNQTTSKYIWTMGIISIYNIYNTYTVISGFWIRW